MDATGSEADLRAWRAAELIEDPSAIDPTPPVSVAAPISEQDAVTTNSTWPEPASSPEADVFAPDPEWRESPGTLDSLMDPDAPLSGELPLGSPPEVRLRPHDVLREEVLTRDGVEQEGFGVEAGRDLPEGFGLDPFAPDPADAGPVHADPDPSRGQP